MADEKPRKTFAEMAAHVGSLPTCVLVGTRDLDSQRSFQNLYNRLLHAGLGEAFIRRALMPEW